MPKQTGKREGYRSLFGPIMLISVGLIFLLSNMGIISAKNIIALIRMWPLLLIIIGLDMLFGRKSPVLGALIGIGAVLLALIIMLIGPSLGLAGDWDANTFTGSVPLDGAETAEITLNLSMGDASVAALSDSRNLIEADLTYIGGEVEFETSGEGTKRVELVQDDDFKIGGPFHFLGWIFNEQDWDISISDRVSLDLDINAGVGNITLDLDDLRLTAFNLNAGAGTVDLSLPAMDRHYDVTIDGGVGVINIDIPDAADIDIQIDGGVGEFNINVPRDAAVRVTSSGGLTDVELPSHFELVSGGDHHHRDNSIWESEGYDNADRHINIEFNGGIGLLIIE